MRGRAPTFCLAMSADAVGQRPARARGRRATNDRKALGAIRSHLVATFDLMLGGRSQAFNRIGANGDMVLRMRVPCWPDAGLCRLQPRTRERAKKGQPAHLGKLIYSLRRSRGAIGRYQGPSGAAWAAAGVPRRPMDGSDACPGVGKGLIYRNKFTQNADAS